MAAIDFSRASQVLVGALLISTVVSTIVSPAGAAGFPAAPPGGNGYTIWGADPAGTVGHPPVGPTRIAGGPPFAGSSPADPTHRSSIAPVHGAAAIVNPTKGYSHEPAPMGIADFGVTGNTPGATGYEYSTTSFEATAQIHSMNVTISGGQPVTAFELNALLVLDLNGTNYTYWIQNGLHVDTASKQFTIGGAYVWNFSSAGAHLSSGELKGNASSMLASDTYYFIPTCSAKFAGQCSTLSWPDTLTGRINATVSSGVPEVEYQYDLGAGWVTYDTVAFPHMTNASVTGFVVDGFSSTPYASVALYDAEWVWVGAGGGTTDHVVDANLTLTLEFWNGHNYQQTRSAWDFGSNTGETASNELVSPANSTTGGAPYAHVASGAGSLGVLYNESAVGFLNVTLPALAQGTLLVDGSPYPFIGDAANLTLSAGRHAISLQDYSNATVPVTINGGQTTYLDLTGAGRTTFEEVGLPAGTSWGVRVGAVNQSGTSTTFSFTLANGTYVINYTRIPGYSLNSTAPLTVSVPAASPIVVGWSRFTYSVPVTESGLPSGTSWWVNVSGVLLSATHPTIPVAVPNGSTAFTVGSAYEYVASPAGGTIQVSGGHFLAVNVEFSVRPTFIAGSVSPANATITINGLQQVVVGGLFNDSVTPGLFTLVAAAPGYISQTFHVNATAGNTTTESIILVQNSSSGLENSTPGSGSSSGIALSTLVLVGVGVAGVAIVAVAALVMVRRRSGPG